MRALTLATLLAALGVATLAGCNIAGPIAYLVHGPPKIEARHTLDRDRPTLIFVDDRINALPRAKLRETIASRAQDLLLKNGTLRNVIDCRGAYAVAAKDREGQITSLVDLGKAVGAEIVVGATVDSFTVEPSGSDRYALVATLRARVIDVNKAPPRVWPDDPQGESFRAEFLMSAGSTPATNVEAAQAQNALAEQAGKAFAELFYAHEASKAAAKGK